MLTGFIGGVVVGIFLAAPLFVPGVCSSMVQYTPRLTHIWEVLETPEQWIGQFWTGFLNMPPGGELGGFIIVPATATILLWSLLGLVIGFFWSLLPVEDERKE